MHDWENTLSKKPEWHGHDWTTSICTALAENPQTIPHFLLTAGPGLLHTEAWIFKKHFPDIEIMGFEPQIDRYKNLKSEFPGELFNMGIAAETCKLDGWMGHISGETDFKVSTSTENEKNYIRQEINCKSIDDVLRGKDSRGVVWLDIEGAELNAIKGSIESMLNNKIIGFLVELSFKPNNFKKSMMIIDILLKCGYIATGSSGKHWYSPEGFIVELEPVSSHLDVFFTSNKIDAANMIYLMSRANCSTYIDIRGI